MKKRFVLDGGQRALVGKQIGGGGEGDIYLLADKPDRAIKIYKESLRPKREVKIRAMTRQAMSAPSGRVAFPESVVTGTDRAFLGFSMRLITGCRPLHELYSPVSRSQRFPESDYRHLVRTARNVALGLADIHQSGCLVGDLNHSGILAAKDATVAFIDVDSFQVEIGGRLYPCEVGVPEYTPPELQGRSLRAIRRVPAHDYFGLAVAIFHLLFMGRHPYMGISKGADQPLGDAIQSHRFAYSVARRRQTGMTPPPNALTLPMFATSVADGFERAFGPDPTARPTAKEWIAILAKLESSLRKCGGSGAHFFPTGAAGCPWCKLTVVIHRDLFPDTKAAVADISVDEAGIKAAIQAIRAFDLPDLESLLPKADQSAKGTVSNQALFSYLLFAVAIGLLFVPDMRFLAVFAGGLGWFVLPNSTERKKRLGEAIAGADSRIEKQLNHLLQRSKVSSVYRDYIQLTALAQHYESLDDALRKELTRLKATRRDRQLAAYLDRFPVRAAHIKGIGPVKAASLISFGIETAADISLSDALAVQGIGPALAQTLVDWRASHERRFRFQPSGTADDVRAEKLARQAFAHEKRKIASQLRQGLGRLKTSGVSVKGLATHVGSDPMLRAAVNDRAKMASQLTAMGATPLPIELSVQVKSASPSLLMPTINYPPSAVSTRRSSPQQAVPSCPSCRQQMVKRQGRYRPYWGCSQFPRCGGTRKIR